MDSTLVMFAYLSPETVLPVTSILATVAGLVLMFGRNTLKLSARWLRLATKRRTRGQKLRGPHVRRGVGVKNQASRGPG